MDGEKSPLRAVAYLTIGLVVLIVAVWVLGMVFRIIAWLVCLALTIALIFVIGFFVYHLVKAAVRSI